MTQNTDQVLQQTVNHPSQALASLSVIAIKQGKVVYENQFGRRYIHPEDAAQDMLANDQTLYRMASVSKMVAAVGAMILVEQGKLDLDADISRYLGFQIRNPHFPTAPITTRMLLSHTSSLRDDAGYNFPIKVNLKSFLVPGGAHYGDGSQWDKASQESSHAPGHFFRYVNLNWGILGSVMEAVSGQRFDHFMRDQLLRPLGMAGGYNPEELSVEELANELIAAPMNEVPTGEAPGDMETLRIYEVVDKQHDDDRFVRAWASFDTLKQGDVIGVRDDGTEIRAEMDARIIFPDANAKKNEEWFYLAKSSQRLQRG